MKLSLRFELINFKNAIIFEINYMLISKTIGFLK